MPVFGSRFQRGGEPSSTSRSAKMSRRPCGDALGGGDDRAPRSTVASAVHPRLRPRRRGSAPAPRRVAPGPRARRAPAWRAATRCATSAGVMQRRRFSRHAQLAVQALAAACGSVPDFEIQKRPQESFRGCVCRRGARRACGRAPRVRSRRASWQPAPRRWSTQVARAARRAASSPTGTRKPTLRGLSVGSGIRRLAAWRRIHLVTGRARALRRAAPRHIRPARWSRNGARARSTRPSLMRSPRSSRLSAASRLLEVEDLAQRSRRSLRRRCAGHPCTRR